MVEIVHVRYSQDQEEWDDRIVAALPHCVSIPFSARVRMLMQKNQHIKHGKDYYETIHTWCETQWGLPLWRPMRDSLSIYKYEYRKEAIWCSHHLQGGFMDFHFKNKDQAVLFKLTHG